MYLKSLKIGKLTLKSNLILAPMAQITNYPFRKICLENECDLVITEMISAKSFFYGNKKTIEMMKIRDDRPVCFQIFGSDIPSLIYTAQYLENQGADMIEINAGCPVPKILKSKSGAFLIKHPSKLYEIIRELKKKIKIPLSVKTRIGWNKEDYSIFEIAKNMENEGLDILHLHLRSVTQKHSGNPNYEIAKKLKDILKIPLIANGGITDIFKAKEMFEKTNCDAISIARATIENPFIFSEIKLYLSENKILTHTLEEKIILFKKYLDLSLKTYGEKMAVINSRRIAGMWFKNFKDASKFRNQFMKARTLNEAYKSIEDLENTILNNQT